MLDQHPFTFGRFLCLIALAALPMARQVNAVMLSFTDQANFLVQLSAPSFEGFENLPNATPGPISAAGFTMSSAGAIAVSKTSVLGAFATEGQQYVRWDSTGGGNIVFNFDNPIHAFGFTTTDAADNPAATLSLTTSAGDSFPSFLANEPNGQARFFGIINEDQVFDTVTMTSNFPDGIGFDEVYFDEIPEPTTATLSLMGLAILGMARR